MSVKEKDKIILIAVLLCFVILFYKIVTMKNDDEDIRRKELRMKYYL